MNARAMWTTWALAGAIATFLVLVTIGLPGAVVLAGGLLLAVGLGRVVPGMSSPASWAAAIVIEVALISGISGLVAVASPRPHGRTVDFAILVVPALVGIVLWLGATLKDPRSLGASPGILSWIVVVTLIAGLGLTRWIASLGKNYAVAWAMSGDARNEVLIMRSILHDGGLTVHQLRAYPAAIDNLTALISGAGGRAGLPPGDLMIHDASAVASVYVLAGVAVALMFIAALIELLPSPLRASPVRLPLGAFVVLFACALTSASPLVLGTALSGGFVSAYATLPVIIGALVLAFQFCTEPSPLPLGLLGVATVVTLFSWPILAVVPGILVAFVAGLALSASFREKSNWLGRWPWIITVCVGLSGLLLALGVGVSQEHRLKTQFIAAGAIITPQTRIIYLAGLIAFGLALTLRGRAGFLQMIATLFVVAAGGVTLRWLISLPPTGSYWTYYAVKTLWLLVSALLWLGFAPALLTIVASNTRFTYRQWRSQAINVALAASCSGVALIVLGFTTTALDPVPTARAGWYQPSAAVVTEVASAGNTYNKFMLWRWTDIGNERLGNFWASLTWDSTPGGTVVPYPPELPGGLELWAYYETGSLPQLCTVLKAIPDMTIITADEHLGAAVRSSCLDPHAQIIVSPPSA